MTGPTNLKLPIPDRKAFRAAEPFPHLVLPDALVDAVAVAREFPPPGWPGWNGYADAYQARKLICSEITQIPEGCQALIHELHAPTFLRWLEELTGIDKLLPDPYLEGGGLHLSGPGGRLAMHTDFHLYARLDLYRRINVIVYLNPAWDEAAGGQLVLRGASGASRMVAPLLGTMVVFQTDDRSVHGFPEITAPDGWRQSIALYYYTARDDLRYGGDTNTVWREHSGHGVREAGRLLAYRGLIFVSRTFSWLAHRANPELGRRR